MTKHTDGPWIYDDTRQYYAAQVIRHNGLIISHIQDHPSMEPAEYLANAKLISAAPTLLEACKLALERLKPGKNIKKDYAKWVAYAALGKAIHEAEHQPTQE